MNCRWHCALSICFLFASCTLITAQTATIQKIKDTKTDCGKGSDPAFAVCRGWWSGKTVSLFNTWMAPDTNPDRRLRLPSPDKKKVIIVNGFQVRLRVDGRTFWTPFGNMHDAEVAWAPDSTRLFVTWSESGELGPWHVQVYEVTDGGFRELMGITKEARKDILRREHKAPIPKWVTPEYRGTWDYISYCEPDMIGSQWMNGSKEILVAARAGPDSGCRYMADIVVYRLDAENGKILQTYKAKEAHRIFGDEDLPAWDEDDDEL